MNTDLQKRIEEAAEEEYPISYIYNDLAMDYEDVNREARIAFIEGAEFGYKEAIKVAKEWLRNNVHRYIYAVNEDGIPQAGIGAAVFAEDFEKDMNKLWEETK